MKFFAAFVAILAVAAANPLKPGTNELAQLEAIVAAIHSPSTDPATAALLEEQLAAIIAATNPISIGAPIVSIPDGVVLPAPAVPEVVLPEPGVLPILPEQPIISPMPVVQPGPIAPISPIVVPMPVVEPEVPSPVVVGQIPAGNSPLVQIIVNVNDAASAAPAPAVTPVVGAQETIVPGPVNVVDQADNIVSPIQVVSPVVVSPVQVAEPIVPGPVNIVDHPVPVVVEPVAVGTPVLPTPVVTLPEELN